LLVDKTSNLIYTNTDEKEKSISYLTSILLLGGRDKGQKYLQTPLLQINYKIA
jgi:hypothetical protein